MKIKNKNVYYENKKIDKTIEKDFKLEQIKRRQISIIIVLFFFMLLSFLNNQSVSIINFFQNKFKVSIGKHAGILLGSFLICIVISGVNYKIYEKKWIKILIALTSITILMFMILGKGTGLIITTKGASAWLNLKLITIQPSEILKIPFIILIANILSKGEKNNMTTKSLIIASALIFIIFGFLIYKENDLGTVLHYTAIYFFMLFLTDIPRNWIRRIISSIILIMSISFYFIFKYGSELTQNYKILRIKAFLEGLICSDYKNDLSYQVEQSLLAFGNGGFFGKSYGNGIQKYSYLPEIHTDFIIALFGEEMGFIGMIWIIGCFFTLYNLIVCIGLDSKDKFAKYMCLGVAGYIITQFIINIFVTLGLLPVFGIPMPIFSYGGSSIITIFIGIGIVLNINKKLKFDK